MPDIDENRNSEDGLAETSMPTSTPSVSEGMDKGTPRADSSGPKSPDPPQYTGAVPDPETNDTSDDPFHEREVNTQEVQQDTPAPADLGNARDPLEEFDWDDLEQRFCTAMEKFQKKEDQIGREYRQWLEVFEAWASVTTIHDPDRAHKRLRTRMAWVQGAEQELEKRRLHYVNVVKAFENAVALIGGT